MDTVNANQNPNPNADTAEATDAFDELGSVSFTLRNFF